MADFSIQGPPKTQLAACCSSPSLIKRRQSSRYGEGKKIRALPRRLRKPSTILSALGIIIGQFHSLYPLCLSYPYSVYLTRRRHARSHRG